MNEQSAEAAPAGDRTDPAGPEIDGPRQVLTFELADEHYGVNILRVQEIKGWTPVTVLPNTPDYVAGVLNLRGSIVPIFDLRRRFGLAPKEHSPTTVVIVLSVRRRERSGVLGIVVDAVSDVVDIPRGELKPRPELDEAADNAFVTGLFPTGKEMAMVLDVDKLFGPGLAAAGVH